MLYVNYFTLLNCTQVCEFNIDDMFYVKNAFKKYPLNNLIREMVSS